MSHLRKLEDDLTTMSRLVANSITHCVKYNDRRRINTFQYPAKLDLKEFDIKTIPQWKELSNTIGKVNQTIELDNKYIGQTTQVSIILHDNNDVDIKYYM